MEERKVITFCHGQKGGNFRRLKGEELREWSLEAVIHLKYDVGVEAEKAITVISFATDKTLGQRRVVSGFNFFD